MESAPKIAFEFAGLPLDAAPCLIVWGHGWGQDREAYRAFIQPFLGQAAHLMLDFPGFGASERPPESWGVADYADAVAALLAPYRAVSKIVWVGHSFGGRVGLRLAARYPELVDGLFLIASAGLPRKRGLWRGLKFHARVRLFKILKFFAVLLGRDLEKLRARFGSADYKSAGKMRPVFLRVIRENLLADAEKIACPACLVYGAADAVTPPNIGERLAKAIKRSQLFVLEGQDHYTVLGDGRALVQKRFLDFLRSLQCLP
jgi:pimeloyl-ACP methyl ester carboxylesterase